MLSSTVFSPAVRLTKRQLKDLTTTDLLSKLGYIRQPHAGVTHWLPLGLATLNNLENLVRTRLNQGGALETSLSALSHSSLWQKTNRWQNEELFKVNADFCLAATAEEEITELVKQYADTYKKMPLIVYQITRKYRNEKRPRGGLLRGREFVMKDAYSFDASKEGALKSFEKMNEIYYRIFSDLRVPFLKANADSGSIGGDLSYEWHFVSDKGEDTLFSCDQCHVTSNVEKVRPYFSGDAEPAKLAAAQYFLTPEDDLVVVYYPADRKLNMKFVEGEDLVDINEKVTKEEEVLGRFKEADKDGFKHIVRLMDSAVKPGTELPDFPVAFNRSRMTTFEGLELTQAQDGDVCSSCKKGHLHSSKGIEVGHTFYLGTKYAEPLEATYMDKEGKPQLYEMGCYGIGISRLLGSLAEVLRDDEGLRWPAVIAPLQATVVRSPALDDDEAAPSLVAALQARGIRVEEDVDPDGGLGQKLNHSKVLGVPLQVIVGKSYPTVEIETRGRIFGDNAKKLYEEKHATMDWECTETRHGLKKHLVPVEHVPEVIAALLSDM